MAARVRSRATGDRGELDDGLMGRATPIGAYMRTADAALREHGFSGEQLLGLARKAAQDALRRHGAHLDPDRFDDLADYMLEVGVRYAARYEPGHGIAIQTFLYRRMRIRYTDWLRLTLGDTSMRAAERTDSAGRASLAS